MLLELGCFEVAMRLLSLTILCPLIVPQCAVHRGPTAYRSIVAIVVPRFELSSGAGGESGGGTVRLSSGADLAFAVSDPYLSRVVQRGTATVQVHRLQPCAACPLRSPNHTDTHVGRAVRVSVHYCRQYVQV